ncbi:unnamed protein product [Amoebophrya sp. A120]|nr:unnamed protein product [Amoebophrya sp. A120]|eukprot:GSA120T00002482001.1
MLPAIKTSEAASPEDLAKDSLGIVQRSEETPHEFSSSRLRGSARKRARETATTSVGLEVVVTILTHVFVKPTECRLPELLESVVRAPGVDDSRFRIVISYDATQSVAHLKKYLREKYLSANSRQRRLVFHSPRQKPAVGQDEVIDFSTTFAFEQPPTAATAREEEKATAADLLEPNLFNCAGHDWGRPVLSGVNKNTDFFRVYDPIQRHYHCALRKAFTVAPWGVFLEDDLSIGPDLFHFFRGMEVLIDNYQHTNVWCASGWNDNGFKNSARDPRRIWRTDFFPGLGWMSHRKIIMEKVLSQWQHYPSTGWDHWIRLLPLGDCVYPEVPRTHHVGNAKGSTVTRAEHKKRLADMALMPQHLTVRFDLAVPDAAQKILRAQWSPITVLSRNPGGRAAGPAQEMKVNSEKDEGAALQDELRQRTFFPPSIELLSQGTTDLTSAAQDRYDYRYLVTPKGYELWEKQLLQTAAVVDSPNALMSANGINEHVPQSPNVEMDWVRIQNKLDSERPRSTAIASQDEPEKLLVLAYRREEYPEVRKALLLYKDHVRGARQGVLWVRAHWRAEKTIVVLVERRSSGAVRLLPPEKQMLFDPKIHEFRAAPRVQTSCYTVCNAYQERCVEQDLHLANRCDVLQQHFPCEMGCGNQEGRELPAYVPANPSALTTKQCLVGWAPLVPRCEAQHAATRRLCVCRKS